VNPAGDGLLNESQQRRLAVTCRHVDGQLADLERVLQQSVSGSPFARYTDDLTPAQRARISDHVRAIRAELLAVLARHGLPPAGARIGAAYAARTQLAFITIAVEELKPRYMRGYGAVSPEAATELNGLVEEIQRVVRLLDGVLAHAGDADLGARLARLERAGAGTGTLETLAEVIDARGLVALRPALEVILDRLEHPRVELAVFGRVSSGKSSLVNRLLGADILPVGVTPVTSVPTRIVHGREPRVDVRFADRGPVRVDVARLAEFVSEQENPANERRVSRVEVAWPSPMLEGGLVVVDTPGLGSLATAGAAETLAYLPRCDVGLVLVDAASPLTAEDVGTIARLHEAGVPVQVLLSKADLLTPADLDRVAAYVTGQLATHLGAAPAVHPVSVLETRADLLDRWRAEALTPIVAGHTEQARAAVERKIGALREAVASALRIRLAAARRAPAAPDAGGGELETDLRRAAARFEQARLALEPARVVPDAFVDETIARVARALAARGLGRAPDDRVAAAAGAELAACVTARDEPVRQELAAVAADTAAALARAARAAGATAPAAEDETAIVRDMPRADLESLRVARPWPALEALGPRAAAWRWRRALGRSARETLRETLRSHAVVVHAWAEDVLARLRRRFEAQAGLYRLQIERGADAGGEDAEAIARDLARVDPGPETDPDHDAAARRA
jgi:GTP-binding protein EngB required for normal cell division